MCLVSSQRKVSYIEKCAEPFFSFLSLYGPLFARLIFLSKPHKKMVVNEESEICHREIKNTSHFSSIQQEFAEKELQPEIWIHRQKVFAVLVLHFSLIRPFIFLAALVSSDFYVFVSALVYVHCTMSNVFHFIFLAFTVSSCCYDFVFFGSFRAFVWFRIALVRCTL